MMNNSRNNNLITKEEGAQIGLLSKILKRAQEDNPDELEYFLGLQLQLDMNVRDMSVQELTLSTLEALEVASISRDVDYESYLDEFYSLPIANEMFAEVVTDVDGNRRIFFNAKGDGDQQTSSGGKGSDDYYDIEPFGNCNCDNPYICVNFADPCYDECLCDLVAEDNSSWSFGQSTIGQIFNGIGNAIQQIGESIGWGSIFDAVFGISDDPIPQPGDTTIVIENDDDSTDWGKIAFFVVLGVVVIGGSIYLYRKLKK